MLRDKLETYRRAAARAVEWVLPRIGPDGAIEGSEDIVFGYYKAIPALWTGARPVEAGRVLQRIRARFFRDGRFETDADAYAGASVGYGYRQSWFAIGTHMMGAYDVSLDAIATLEGDLEPRSGGLGNAVGDAVVDWGVTCCAITALLAGNRVAAAIRAGELIEAMIAAQPDPSRMVMRWDAASGRLAPTPGDAPRRGWDLTTAGSRQTYWYLGIALYAFARLHRVDPAGHWLESAERVLAFALDCRADFAGNMNTSKLAWGASQMAGVSPDGRYRDLAVDVADWMVESQRPSGIWVRNPAAHDEQTQPIPITLDTTMDRAFYLTETAAALAAAETR